MPTNGDTADVGPERRLGGGEGLDQELEAIRVGLAPFAPGDGALLSRHCTVSEWIFPDGRKELCITADREMATWDVKGFLAHALDTAGEDEED